MNRDNNSGGLLFDDSFGHEVNDGVGVPLLDVEDVDLAAVLVEEP